MDRVSGGGFLRGEDGELGADWVELEWLKGRGYYSVGAFVANRLEVGLRLAWMSCCGSGRKRGVRLKDKVAGAGVAANVFWRKKGCLDWWQGLGEDTRRKILNGAIGKAAKSLIPEILKETTNVSGEDSMSLFPLVAGQSLGYANSESLRRKNRKFSDDSAFNLASRENSTRGRTNSFDIIIDKLSVLLDVVELMSPCWYRDMSNIFFSSLDSINSVADCILRRLRGLLMVISMDCMKLELLGDEKGMELPKRSRGKPVAGGRKKKRKPQAVEKLKTKLPNDVDESLFDRSDKACNGKIGFADLHRRDGITDEISSCSVKMEQSQVLILGKEKTMTKKNKKGKRTRSRCNNSDKLQESEGAFKDTACPPLISLNQLSTNGGESDCSIITGVSSKQKIVTVSQSSSSSSTECSKYNLNGTDTQHHSMGCVEGVGHVSHKFHSAGRDIVDQAVVLKIETSKSTSELSDGVPCDVLACEAATTPIGRGSDSGVQHIEEKSIRSDKFVKTVEWNRKSTLTQLGKKNIYKAGLTSPTPYLSYEWPSSVPLYFQSLNSHILPAADRLHLDVGHNWHSSIRQPYVRTSRSEGGGNRILSRPLPISLDWPPIVRNASGFSPPLTCNYDSELISRRKTALAQNFSAHGAQKVVFSAKTSDDERKFSGDLPEEVNTQELMDDYDCQWMSEEELEMHAVPGMDYSQYFGGGAMYWNTLDQPGSGLSRPPSLSSDDSLWAWHEADMNRAVDDMLAISSSYSTNGLTSPPSTSFCSPFDPMGSGHQTLGYVVAGNEVSGNFLHAPLTATDSATEDVSGSLNSLSGNIEGRAADSLYPILRPIIIPSMSKQNHGPQSPCITTSRHEQSRMKRPPSPVVLCVPRAPRLPPPSSVSGSRKQRGFPNVRSGSSSPRQWGIRGWYPDRTNVEEACLHMDGPEVVWSPWRNKNLSATHTMIQPLTGVLLQDHHFAMSQLARDQEHPDVSLPLQPPELENCSTRKASLCLMHSILHKDIELFCRRVAAENLVRKPFINWAVKRVARSLQVLWPRSRTNIFGSNATGLSLPTSDVDLVVCLPPVRNLEPIKEAGILEGRNGIKETCLQHAARYLANQEWVKNDSLRTVENTAIPLIMLVVDVPYDLVSSACNIQSAEEPSCVAVEQDDCSQPDAVGSDDMVSPTFSRPNCNGVKDVKSIRIDISFKSPSHTGLQTTELVKALTEQFSAAAPLALVLKQFLADRSLDQSYSGGLSSYCLVLLVTRFLQHEHHLGRPIDKIFGGLLMDFLYFFGNMFDPRRMRISVQGSGTYINRERGYSIDPLYIDDPLFPTNNVGRNCFRIHQCIKAFSEAYSTLENEIANLDVESDEYTRPYRFLSKIVPSIILEDYT